MNLFFQKSFKVFLLLICYFISFAAFATEQLIIEPDAGREPILNMIQKSKHNIHLVMYGLTDKSLISALVQAQWNGKTVRVLLEPHPYKAENENTYAIHRLHDNHVLLQSANPEFKLTHQKTLIVDNELAMIMTFNFTHSTFTRERNFALVLDDPMMVKEINQVFDNDWQRQPVTTNQSSLIWSPETSQEKILNFIQSAHKNLDIYAQDLTDYKIIGVLAAAAREGKTVRVLLSHVKRQHWHNKLKYLQRAGVDIHFSKDLMIHAKVIIADQARALLGSTNFTYPSMQFNRELSIVTMNKEVVEQLEKTFQHDW